MKTILVWVLVIYLKAGYSGGPLVVDNLASSADCERLGQRATTVLDGRGEIYEYSCTQVRKVAP